MFDLLWFEHKAYRWMAVFAAVVGLMVMAACTRAGQGPIPTVAPVAATPAPIEVVATVPPLSTMTDDEPSVLLEAPGIKVPETWYATNIELPDVSGVLFVEQDPAILAQFDDPQMALPPDFAGGALIFTPLPPEAELDVLRADMENSLSILTDQDFEAMLFAADQVGLINLAAVSSVQLDSARLDVLGDCPALLLEGTVSFEGNQSIFLNGKIWLTWTDESFVVFYALATDLAWSSLSDEFAAVRQSVRLC